MPYYSVSYNLILCYNLPATHWRQDNMVSVTITGQSSWSWRRQITRESGNVMHLESALFWAWLRVRDQYLGLVVCKRLRKAPSLSEHRHKHIPELTLTSRLYQENVRHYSLNQSAIGAMNSHLVLPQSYDILLKCISNQIIDQWNWPEIDPIYYRWCSRLAMSQCGSAFFY